MRTRRLFLLIIQSHLTAAGLILRITFPASAKQTSLILSPQFEPRILSTSGESPLALRIFITAVNRQPRTQANGVRVIKDTHGIRHNLPAARIKTVNPRASASSHITRWLQITSDYLNQLPCWANRFSLSLTTSYFRSLWVSGRGNQSRKL
jgi:hypothetical protein